MRRLLMLIALLTGLVLGAGLCSAPVDAGTPRWKGVITFEKNWHHPDRSTLTWRLKKHVGDHWRVVDEASWRAGSGMLGRRGRNACVHDIGWLPDGTYRVRQYVDYPGQLIKGRAFRVDNKRCRNGTLRFDLFIHTEQAHRNRQCPDRRGDQVCRWEYPRIDDYLSHGCIKMSPTDLRSLVAHFHKAFRPGVYYPRSRVVLRVR